MTCRKVRERDPIEHTVVMNAGHKILYVETMLTKPVIAGLRK